jgi:hypothetical protein
MNEIRLWLDDVRAMPPRYTHWAKTASQAIKLLETGKVTECSLDHDLGNQVETGYDVAKWIEYHAHDGTLPKIRCKVHSQNVVGAKNIKMALQSAYRAWGT